MLFIPLGAGEKLNPLTLDIPEIRTGSFSVTVSSLTMNLHNLSTQAKTA